MNDNRRQPVSLGLPTGVILALQRLFGPRWREKACELLDAEAARLAKGPAPTGRKAGLQGSATDNARVREPSWLLRPSQPLPRRLERRCTF